MGRRSHHLVRFDPEQAAALHHLVEAFCIEQVTVTVIQASQDLIPITRPAQASLLEEAS